MVEFDGAEAEDAQQVFEVFNGAVRHVLMELQTRLGVEWEGDLHALENGGSLEDGDMDEDDVEELRHLLFSCHVLETFVGPCPSPEFPETIAALKAHLLPEIIPVR